MSEERSESQTPENRSSYWEQYYAEHADRTWHQRPLPSQFAVFVAGELTDPANVVEFGCGGGRDSLFFASYGHAVTGVDRSAEAVRSAANLCSQFDTPAQFVQDRVDSGNLEEAVQLDPTRRTVVYARFFVHAITDDEEESFLKVAARLTKPGDLLAAEYRTVRDQSGTKVTASHFRRFVTPGRFQAEALALGFDVSYGVEGFGFAKYKSDDAYVARALFDRL